MPSPTIALTTGLSRCGARRRARTPRSMPVAQACASVRGLGAFLGCWVRDGRPSRACGAGLGECLDLPGRCTRGWANGGSQERACQQRVGLPTTWGCGCCVCWEMPAHTHQRLNAAGSNGGGARSPDGATARPAAARAATAASPLPCARGCRPTTAGPWTSRRAAGRRAAPACRC
eukprot:4606286-Prymnesium_polylepis.1